MTEIVKRKLNISPKNILVYNRNENFSNFDMGSKSINTTVYINNLKYFRHDGSQYTKIHSFEHNIIWLTNYNFTIIYYKKIYIIKKHYIMYLILNLIINYIYQKINYNPDIVQVYKFFLSNYIITNNYGFLKEKKTVF